MYRFLILFFVITSAWSDGSIKKSFLLKPDLTMDKIGFVLKEDELDLMHQKISHVLEVKFDCDISIIEQNQCKEEVLQSKDIYIFHILDYYLTYHTMGYRNSYIKVLILKYSGENSYNSPVKFKMMINKHYSSWGRNGPLEKIVDSLAYSDEYYSRIGILDSSTLKFSLKHYLTEGIPFYSSDFLIEPDYSVAKMGYRSGDSEIFDFSHHLAGLCETIIDDDVQIIKKSELEDCKNINRIFKIDFNLYKSKMDFVIYKKEFSNPYYKFHKELKFTNDWNENDEYTKKINFLFKKIKRDYDLKFIN